MRSLTALAGVAALLVAVAGCTESVSQSEYEQLEAERNEWRVQAAELRTSLDAVTDIADRSERQIAQLQAEVDRLAGELTATVLGNESGQTNVDRAAALAEFLAGYLEATAAGQALTEEQSTSLQSQAAAFADPDLDVAVAAAIDPATEEARSALIGHVLDQIRSLLGS